MMSEVSQRGQIKHMVKVKLGQMAIETRWRL